MQEFWFCSGCKSMNRGADKRCYKCRAPKEEATLATVAHKPQDVVLTPGLDEEHREVAWTLMYRQQYISAWKLGYFAAGLILITLAVTTFTTALGALLIFTGTATTGAGSASVAILSVALLALAGLGLLMVVVHSAFLCLTSMAAPALGSGSPRFDPFRAAVWWIESALWALRGGLAFVVPPMLAVAGLFIGGIILGIAVGVVWAVCAFWVLGDPITNLGKPKRLLQDLWDRLAVPGSPDSRIVSLWSLAWGAARGVEYAVAAMVFILVLVLALVGIVAAVMGTELEPASAAQTELVGRVIADLILIVQFIADGIGLLLLAQITIGLSNRQRAREAWVLGGLADSRSRAYADSMARDAAAQAGYAPPVAPPMAAPAPVAPIAALAAAPPPAPVAPIAALAEAPPPAPVAPPIAAPASAPASVAPPAPAPMPMPAPPPMAPPAPAAPIAASAPAPAPTPDFGPLPSEELPTAWLRAIRQAEESAPPAPAVGPPAAAVEVESSDRPIIQPSGSSLSRYRVPNGAPEPATSVEPPPEPAAPIEPPPADLDLGGGI